MTRVIWTGRVASAALAVPCTLCGATIGEACNDAPFPLPHRERDVRAEAFGFRDVAEPGGLFDGK